jgi:hypothetical protein
MKTAISTTWKQVSLCLLLGCLGPVLAQDLEPRRWTPLPLGTRIVTVAYGYTEADISFDPVTKITDTELENHTLIVAHVNSFKMGDKLARFDAFIPWQNSEWDGSLNGESKSREQSGLADPVIRLSLNLAGAPAAKPAEMKGFLKSNPVNTVVGTAISVSLPFGSYREDKLLNLGQNRFIVRPQIGMVHTRGPWSYEVTGSVLIFTDNDDFFDDTKREQDPLYAIQTHMIYMLKPGTWTSLSAGYAKGGTSTVDGDRKEDRIGNFLSALSLGFKVAKNQSFKVAYLRGRTRKESGADFDSLVVGWSLSY